MFNVPELVFAKVKLSIVPAPEFISIANEPAPDNVPIEWLVILPFETVTAPLLRFRVPSISAPLFNVSVPSTYVVPLPVIAFANVPVALNVPVLAIVPPSFSILDVKEPDSIDTLLVIEPSVTITSPVLIFVVPAPVIPFAKVPPVNSTVPLVTSNPVPIPAAFVVNVPDNRFICWLIVFPFVKDTLPVEISVLPAPVISEFIVPFCTSSPCAILFAIPFVVVIPFVATNLPPVIVSVSWIIAPEVVVPPVIVVEPLALVIFTKLFVPLKVKSPLFPIPAPSTF